MQSLRIALVQTDWPGDRDTMVTKYRELVAQASKAGATLVCLPEFSISPYFPGTRDDQGFDWAEPVSGGPSDQVFGELARENGVTLVGSIYEKDEQGRYWDTATVHDPAGRLIHFTRKVHIPSGEGYYETYFFEGFDGYPVHDLGSVKLAVPTCYDQWFPELARIYALEGAELIFYPTAIGSEPTAADFDSQPSWQTIMRGHAIANGVYVAAANRTGTENDARFYGSSFICDPTGKILVQAGRDTTEFIVADLDPNTLEHWRTLFPLLHQRRPETYGRITQPASVPLPKRWRGHEAFKAWSDRIA
ncbi:MAG: nitrilase-related carbon-nitrogen hydrolase [Pseudomonadota bacterium]